MINNKVKMQKQILKIQHFNFIQINLIEII